MESSFGKGKYKIKLGTHPHTNMISQLAIMRRGKFKCRILKMHLKIKRSATYHNSVQI